MVALIGGGCTPAGSARYDVVTPSAGQSAFMQAAPAGGYVLPSGDTGQLPGWQTSFTASELASNPSPVIRAEAGPVTPPAAQSNAPASAVVTTPVPAASSNAPNAGTAVPVVSALIDQVKNVATSPSSGKWFDGIPNWLLIALGLGGTVLVARSFAR